MNYKRLWILPAAIAIGGVLSAQDSGCCYIPTASIESVNAQFSDEPAGEWTFEQCIEWAINHNTEIRKTLLEYLQAEQDLASAKDQWLPTVSFGMNHSYTNYPSTQQGGSSNVYSSSYGINGSWTVWDGNQRSYRKSSAELLMKQQSYMACNRAVAIKLSILEAYINIMYCQEAVEIAQSTLEVSTAQAARAYKLKQAGKISEVDYAQIDSQKAQDEYSVVQAESSLAQAKVTLKNLLDVHKDINLEVVTVKFGDDLIVNSLPAKQDVFDSALAWLPSLKSNDISEEIAANDIKLAKASRMPTIGLSASVGTGYNTAAHGSWGSQMGHGVNENIGLNFSLPIFDGNSAKRSIAKAKLSAIDVELDREDLVDNLVETLDNLFIEINTSRAKYAAGLRQLDATQQTATLTDRKFELGSVNALELLTAHNDLLNARLQLLQSKYMAVLSYKTINYYLTGEMSLS
jgi:outer membrane protein